MWSLGGREQLVGSAIGCAHVPIHEDVVEVEVHDEVDQALLHAARGSIALAALALAGEDADGVGRLSVGHCGRAAYAWCWGWEVDGGEGPHRATRHTRAPENERVGNSAPCSGLAHPQPRREPCKAALRPHRTYTQGNQAHQRLAVHDQRTATLRLLHLLPPALPALHALQLLVPRLGMP